MERLRKFFFGFIFRSTGMSEDDNRVNEILKQLKSGAVLIKQKFNGKKFPRRFFLHARESFVSYERSRKIFGKPRLCE
jgi:hypothetical protein